jgi:hypothetical protein
VIAPGFGLAIIQRRHNASREWLECSAVPAKALNLIAGSDPLKTQEELKRSLAVEVARAKTRRP